MNTSYHTMYCSVLIEVEHLANVCTCILLFYPASAGEKLSNSLFVLFICPIVQPRGYQSQRWYNYRRVVNTGFCKTQSSSATSTSSPIGTQSRQSAKLFLQSSELGLPQPLTRRRVCPPALVHGRGLLHTRLGERGSQFRRGDRHCSTLGILYMYFVPETINLFCDATQSSRVLTTASSRWVLP